jgi:spore coat protein CotH
VTTPARLLARLAAAALLIAIAAAVAVRADDQAAPFFDDGGLEDIHLLINSRDWDTLKATFRGNTYYPGDFKWRDTTVRNVGIRSRGNGSRSGTKPGLRIDFDRYSTRQKFLGLKSIVLRNQTQDPSHLHERLSMALFAHMGLAAPRELHVRFFVNNAYAGLYTAVEAVDKDFLTRAFGENDGYLFDYDYDPAAPPYYFEHLGADPALYVPKPFNPETNETNPRPEILERMISTINSAGASFRTEIEGFVDVRTLMRYVAIEAFLAETDGFLGDWGMNNFYIYRPKDQNRFTIIPWDKSHAFVAAPTLSVWHNITDVPAASRNRLMTRLLEQPDLRTLYLDTLVEAARAASAGATAGAGGWLERELDRQLAQIRDAALADTLSPFTSDEFVAGVDAIRTFARQRPGVVLDEVARTR